MKSIWALMEGFRGRYLAAIAALTVASCFLYLVPLIPQIVIDGVFSESREEASSFVRWCVEILGGVDFVRANLWIPGLLVAILAVAAAFFTYLRGRWSAEASEGIVRRTRDQVYDHLQHLPCPYFDRTETGDLIQRCTSDVETLRMFLATQVVEIGRAVIMLLVPLPLMLAIDVRMTIVSVVFIPFVVCFSFFFFVKIRDLFKSVDEADGAMTSTLQENLTGIRVVRAFARQEFEKEKFDSKNDAHRALDYRLYVLIAYYWGISDLLCFAQKAAVLVAGAYWLATGELAVGAFFFFLSAVAMFIWPVRMMGRILADLGKAVVALERLQEILDEPMESVPDVPEAPVGSPLEGRIEFESVSFGHSEESPVLHEISFRAEPGKTMALLGPSGCGKSTIVNLLLRLYDYDAGSIRLDGFELSQMNRQFARSQMAVVMQEPFLYSKSLRENLKIGRPAANDGEMIEVTSVACVHESITEFESGYDTLLGERGVTLSGGQRQRVALARALLQKPSILILDDALSAVDAETESMILEALQQRHGKQTTIVIAHRISTLMHADEILVLDHGRIVQRGTHTTLLAEDGLYRRLWEIQSDLESEIKIVADVPTEATTNQ